MQEEIEDEFTVTTKDNELTLEEMSGALPDTSTVMARVGHSWWHLIYAARGGNWGLAEYYHDRVAKLARTLAVLRPKHRERLEVFQTQALRFVTAAIEARDLARLEEAYATATELANHLHDESGYPYVRWILPTEAPKGLDLGPVASNGDDAAPAPDGKGDGQGRH
jgi:hypothetical protein